MLAKEKSLIKQLYGFPEVVADAGTNRSPALIANYMYDLAKEFNQFYQEIPIFKENDTEVLRFRLQLCNFTRNVLLKSSSLLGMQMPEKM
jgi:arginyl-tRNA synthetase